MAVEVVREVPQQGQGGVFFETCLPEGRDPTRARLSGRPEQKPSLVGSMARPKGQKPEARTVTDFAEIAFMRGTLGGGLWFGKQALEPC